MNNTQTNLNDNAPDPKTIIFDNVLEGEATDLMEALVLWSNLDYPIGLGENLKAVWKEADHTLTFENVSHELDNYSIIESLYDWLISYRDENLDVWFENFESSDLGSELTAYLWFHLHENVKQNYYKEGVQIEAKERLSFVYTEAA